MNSNQSTFISNNNHIHQQPSKHKSIIPSIIFLVLKNSLKLTLKSLSKNKFITNNSSTYIPQVTCRLSQSQVGNYKNTQRQILKKNIDVRLNKAYSTIVRHKSIQLTGKKYNKNQVSQSPFPPINVESQRNNTHREINSVYKQLPYQLLRSYIQNIYQEYSLKDPLEDPLDLQLKNNSKQILLNTYEERNYTKTIQPQTPPRSIKFHNQQHNKISTKKKILLLKNHFIDELNTEKRVPLKIDTNKKISTQTTQFIQPVAYQHNLNASSHKKKLSFAQNNNQIPIICESFIDHSKNDGLGETKFSMSSVNQLGYSSVNTRINHSINHSINESKVQNQRKVSNDQIQFQNNRHISQLFRYCFVCEQSILQANIKAHQKSCIRLQQILSRPELSKGQFILMMDRKISKIQKQVTLILNEVDSKQTGIRLNSIKQKVLEWIGVINQQSKLNKSNQFNKTIQTQKTIQSMINNTKLLRTFDLVNKLKWFVHLKRNFIKKIQLNPNFV